MIPSKIIPNYLSENQTSKSNQNPTKTILQDYYTSLTNQNPSNPLPKIIQAFEELSISRGLSPSGTSSLNNHSVLSDIVLDSFTNLLKKEQSKQLVQKAKTKQDLKTILLIDQLSQQETTNNQDLITLCTNLLKSSYSKRKIRELRRNYKKYNNQFSQLQDSTNTKEKLFQLEDLDYKLSGSILEGSKTSSPKLQEILQQLKELEANCSIQISNTLNEVVEKIRTEEIQTKPTLKEQIEYLTEELKLIKKVKSHKTGNLDNKIEEIEEQLGDCQDLNKQFGELKKKNIKWAGDLLHLKSITVAEVENLTLPEKVFELYETLKDVDFDSITYEGYSDVSKVVREHRDTSQKVRDLILRKMNRLKEEISHTSIRYKIEMEFGRHLINRYSIIRRKDPIQVREYKQKINSAIESCISLEEYIDISNTKSSLETLLRKLSYMPEINFPLLKRALYKKLKRAAIIGVIVGLGLIGYYTNKEMLQETKKNIIGHIKSYKSKKIVKYPDLRRKSKDYPETTNIRKVYCDINGDNEEDIAIFVNDRLEDVLVSGETPLKEYLETAAKQNQIEDDGRFRNNPKYLKTRRLYPTAEIIPTHITNNKRRIDFAVFRNNKLYDIIFHDGDNLEEYTEKVIRQNLSQP